MGHEVAIRSNHDGYHLTRQRYLEQQVLPTHTMKKLRLLGDEWKCLQETVHIQHSAVESIPVLVSGFPKCPKTFPANCPPLLPQLHQQEAALSAPRTPVVRPSTQNCPKWRWMCCKASTLKIKGWWFDDACTVYLYVWYYLILSDIIWY